MLSFHSLYKLRFTMANTKYNGREKGLKNRYLSLAGAALLGLSSVFNSGCAVYVSPETQIAKYELKINELKEHASKREKSLEQKAKESGKKKAAKLKKILTDTTNVNIGVSPTKWEDYSKESKDIDFYLKDINNYRVFTNSDRDVIILEPRNDNYLLLPLSLVQGFEGQVKDANDLFEVTDPKSVQILFNTYKSLHQRESEVKTISDKVECPGNKEGWGDGIIAFYVAAKDKQINVVEAQGNGQKNVKFPVVDKENGEEGFGGIYDRVYYAEVTKKEPRPVSSVYNFWGDWGNFLQDYSGYGVSSGGVAPGPTGGASGSGGSGAGTPAGGTTGSGGRR